MSDCAALGVAPAVGGEAGEAAAVRRDPGVDAVGQGAEGGKLVQAEEPGPVEGDGQRREDGPRASDANALRVHRPGRLFRLREGDAETRRGARLLEWHEPEPMVGVQALHERRAERSEVSGAIEKQRQRGMQAAHQYGPLQVLTRA